MSWEPKKSPVFLLGEQTAILRSPDGEEIVEEVTCLGRNRLFGILARPTARPSGPTVVMLNSGKLDHLGPGRLWVHLARSWARVGVAVLRVDLSGLGDSPVQEGREPTSFILQMLLTISLILRASSRQETLRRSC